jgi:hypothetical protein
MEDVDIYFILVNCTKKNLASLMRQVAVEHNTILCKANLCRLFNVFTWLFGRTGLYLLSIKGIKLRQGKCCSFFLIRVI